MGVHLPPAIPFSFPLTMAPNLVTDVEHSPEAVRVITHQWIEQQIKQREAEFTENRTASVFCGTYNVNAKTIADEDVRQLESWLFSDNEKTADIYAVVSDQRGWGERKGQ